jgi:DnaJ-class molecular chaperone
MTDEQRYTITNLVIRRVKLTNPKCCPVCNGVGYRHHTPPDGSSTAMVQVTCHVCSGSGLVYDREEFYE